MAGPDAAGTAPETFFNLYRQGFARVAVATPAVTLADPAANVARIAALAAQADAEGAVLLLTPELSVSAYSLDDLLHQGALLDAVERSIGWLCEATAALRSLIVVGAPLRVTGRLHNAAVVLHRGRAIGAIPKSHLPNYREFYEARHFAPAAAGVADTVVLGGIPVPFGTDLLFEAADLPGFCLGIEICEDLWVPIPPSARAAMAGATVIANLSASNATVGKADWRHGLAASTSGRQICAYL
jgi:NAD+ synthase (glutamine-hydrolysing)